PAYLGRKRGEIARTRTTVLQAHTHQWLGTFGSAGNGDYRGELRRARAVIESYASALSLPLSPVLTRLDGLYGNAAPLADLLASIRINLRTVELWISEQLIGVGP